MDVQWNFVHRIVLDDRPIGYRPDRRSLSELRKLFPDCKILGFGKYGVNDYFYLLVHTVKLPINIYQMVDTLSLKSLIKTPLISPINPQNGA